MVRIAEPGTRIIGDWLLLYARLASPGPVLFASAACAMKKSAKKAGNSAAENSGVEAVFRAYPKPVKAKLLALRRLIFDTARATEGVGALEETLKWGQPSYLTPQTKSGSTIRIDRAKAADGQYAIYFHCQTDPVATFRDLYPELNYDGNRSVLLDAADDLPKPALRHCVALALTYHLNKRKTAGRNDR